MYTRFVLFATHIFSEIDHMSIRDKIGTRIAEARKESRLTIQELSKLTGDLKPARISNWEQGLRSPGPDEITKLSKALNVSPAYLMCLSDRKEINFSSERNIRLLPLYDEKALLTLTLHEPSRASSEIPIASDLANHLSDSAFAYQLNDSSMTPHLLQGDLLFCDPNIEVKPGEFGLFVTSQLNEPLIRKFREQRKDQYELITLNQDWASTTLDKNNKIKFSARIIGLQRKI